MISIIEKISSLYNTALSNIFGHVNSILTHTIQVYLPLILTLYFLILGYNFILGNVNKSNSNKIRLFIVLPILIALVFNYSMYLNMIVTPILMLKDYLVTAISSIASSTNDNNAFAMIDTIFMNIFTFVKSELMGDFFSNPFNFILGVIILLIYGALYIWIGYFMIKSLLATAFFLMVGVIPIICFAFDATQHIFYAWLRSVFTYFLFAPISAFFMLFIYWISIGTSSNLENQTESLFLLITSGSLMVLYTKDIPEYANNLTSGMSGGGDATSSTGAALRWGSVGAKKGISGGKTAIETFKKIKGS